MLLGVSNLNWVDLIIIAVLACGFIQGFVKGVVRQAFSLGGLIVGLLLGSVFYKPVALFMQNHVNMSDTAAKITAFCLILLLVPLLLNLVGDLLAKLIKAVKLGFADRFLGGAFGLLKFLLILGLVIKVLDFAHITDFILQDNSDKTQSRFYEPVRKTTDKCLRWTWNSVSEVIDNIDDE